MSDTMITADAPAAAPAPAPDAPVATPVTDLAAPAADTPADPAAPTAEQVAADAAKAEADAKPAGAPEKYTDFTAPEGAKLDGKVMEQFNEAARELNLTQEQAQKMVDKMAPITAARQAEQFEAVKTEWLDQSKADKEFGGDKLDASMVYAKNALKNFGTPEFTALLNESGLGNHPEVIRFMVKAGRATGEDKVVTGGIPASGIRSAGDVLYPTSKSK